MSKQDIDQTHAGTKIHTHLEGQLKACNLILLLAATPDFLPEIQSPNHHNSLKQTAFLKRFHKNLFRTAVEEAEMQMNPNFIKSHELGEWRQSRKFINNKEMPNPMNIQYHIHDWWNDLIQFHNDFRNKIDNPRLLEPQDLKSLSDKAYETNLKLCCIKPFDDGSNRVARCVENTLRLYFGLPFKIISHEDEPKMNYLNDIKKMQNSYPE